MTKLRMENSLDVEIISSDDSIMNFFMEDVVVATDTQLVIQELNIWHTIFKYSHGTHTNKILSAA